MHTKTIMTCAAMLLLATGIICTFFPELAVETIGLDQNKPQQLLTQVLGGLYFGFGMLNWMARSTRIGGIYNRPIAIANFSHFFISGIALLKGLTGQWQNQGPIWYIALPYVIMALAFGVILFKNPIPLKG